MTTLLTVLLLMFVSGDEVIIHAICNAFQVSLKVFSSMAMPSRDHVFRPFARADFVGPQLEVGHMRESHYVSVVPAPPPTVSSPSSISPVLLDIMDFEQ